MINNQTNAPLFATSFAKCLAQRAIAALCDSTLIQWQSNLELCYDYDDKEMDGEGSADLLRPREKSAPDQCCDLRTLGTVAGPPAAKNMTSAEIAQLYVAGDDPWACHSLEVSPLCNIKPRPAALLAVLRVCAAFEDAHMLSQMGRPGGITLLVCPSGGMRAVLRSVLADLVAHWQIDHPAVAGVQIATFEQDAQASASERRRSINKLRQSIDKKLEAHAPVLAVCGTQDNLSEAQLSLVRQVLDWPSLSPAAILEALRYTHSATQQLAEGEIVRRLPDASALRRLEPMQINAAFEEATTLRVADRLAEIARPRGYARNVTLQDVKGLGATGVPLQRMLDDLALWQEGGVAWTEVTRSALFFGPPGTGKTLLASALAGSAEVPLIATSYAECQRHGHQGDMLAALSAAFERAAQAAPAVLFIDELDSFSIRTSEGQNASYLRGVVNGLLEQLSRANEVEGLVILAATNHLDSVDPAIVRSGRFDLKLELPLPDRAGIEAILNDKLGEQAASKLDLRTIAERLLGAPGATAEALVREALGRARAQKVDLRQEHLEAAADAELAPFDPDLLHRIAVHEAGHVLAALRGPLPLPERVWVASQGGGVRPGYVPTLTRDLAGAQLQMFLAGRAAEELLLERPGNGSGLGTTSDLAQATRLAAAIELQWSFGSSGWMWHDIDAVNLHALPADVQHRIHTHLEQAHGAVRKMLAQDIDHLKHITSELVQKRELQQVDLERLAKRIAAEGPEEAATPDMQSSSAP